MTKENVKIDTLFLTLLKKKKKRSKKTLFDIKLESVTYYLRV